MDALKTLSRLPAGINAYTDRGHRAKRSMHSAGRAFLQRLATDLGLATADRDIRSNPGGIAVSGEVTLHTDDIYVQLSDSLIGRAGVQVLYRTCNGRADYCGGQNRYTYLKDLAKPDRYEWFVAELQRLTEGVAA
jgi:hypothetical protein